ncbi:MAG: IS630 family transposase [Rhodothermales bacterium]
MWCIPPRQNAAFVAAMEDVLSVYERVYDDQTALLCLDETSKQLLKETRTPLPCEPGQLWRYDYEYERCGVANLFMLFDPVRSWRRVVVRDQRTAIDFAEVVREALRGPYAKYERIVLVLDNLNTHTVASLYKAFSAAEAFALADRIEWHYTPKHGSWLNMAEIELSVLSRQCLSRRIESRSDLERSVQAWSGARNAKRGGVKWRFSVADARCRLRHLYPAIDG